MATHCSILAWRIPQTEELGGLQSTGRKESDTTERLHFHFHYGLSGKESPSQRKRHRFNLWVGKIPLEKEMATHSSILAWRIPWTEEPGGL